MNIRFVIVVALLLQACSTLEVQVGVLNPEIVRQRAGDDRLASTLPIVMAETPVSIKQFFADRVNIHGQFYAELRREYLAEASKLAAGSSERANLEGAARNLRFTPEQRQDYSLWEARALAATESLQKLWPMYKEATEVDTKTRLRSQLLNALDEREAISDAVDQSLIHDLDLESNESRLNVLPVEQRAALAARIQRSFLDKIATQTSQLFDPGGIQHSPYAYYVAKANDDDWAEAFDHSFGKGRFGNTDIAIKALGPGNFTIKGVSFNPADVAATAAKVTSQTVLLAAQVAGVPVKLSGTPDATKSGAALAQSSNVLSTSLALNQRVDTQMLSHRDALRRIAAAVVNERKVVLEGTDEERRAALASIKAVYESQASRLRIVE